MAALRAPPNRLGPKSYLKSYPTPSSEDLIFLEMLSAAQSPGAAGIRCTSHPPLLLQPPGSALLEARRAASDADSVVPNIDELFTDFGLALDDGESEGSPTTTPFDADEMEGFLCSPFEAGLLGLLSIIEDSATRGALPTFAVAEAGSRGGRETPLEPMDGSVPDSAARMSTNLQDLTLLDLTVQDLTVPETKKRRKKVPTPAAKQTPGWHRKRERNNHAAALNRAKEKATKVAAKQRHQSLLFRNGRLRVEVQALEAELVRLQPARACGGAAFLDGLPEVGFDLLPPELPRL